MDERKYKIALSLLQGIGIANTKTLVAYAGNCEAVFTKTDKELADLCELSVSKVKKFNRKAALERAEQEIEFINKIGAQLHYYQDGNYPSTLKFCEDGPIVLFSLGNVQFHKQNIAIVGTRKITPYGKKNTQDLVRDIAHRNVQIISGLAHGVDKEAHEAALANDLSTIAVLGHGLELIYPSAHKLLAKKMLDTGGLITEFLSFTPGDPSNFPKRNRIVAGLADATVVVESAITGGSLITANLAIDYNRDVFAFPGNVDRPFSAGCNHLIRNQKAHLITNATDMNVVMGWSEEEEQEETAQTDLFDSLVFEEQEIISCLKKVKTGLPIDEIALQIKCSASELSLHLMNLELKGKVEAYGGKSFRLI